jgi:riboflavin biosynthesis pyrimidine reductase
MGVTDLRPLETLFEARGLAPTELTTPLEHLYGGGLGFSAPTVYANFVSSLDGTVALPAISRSNKLISAGSEADRFVMALLRGLADAVVTASGTLAESPTGTWLPARAHPPSAEMLAELRRVRGQPERPELAILTGSATIDPDHPALAERTVVLTTEGGAKQLRGRVPASAELVPLAAEGPIEPSAVIAALRERGHRSILLEAGPNTFGTFAAAGVVDELFLTVSPLLTGGSAQTRLSLVEGVDPLRDGLVRGELLSLRRHDGHLFLRYRLAPEALATEPARR